ncbi:hypothetical protein BKA70DRAFT_291469 [Coprinopsis sp. MPI-PUGE-AT-0042]|nr:hypothetical protein BKA70DRAFT_291469 [Coprinopsis sp. MPI-PUGE-AT-0042]
MGATISWVDDSDGAQWREMPGGLDGATISIMKPAEIDTVNINGGNFTTVAGDNITCYNYNVTQTVMASDGSKLKAILSWISTINFLALHQDVHEKWTPGTGRWLMKSLLFIQWLESICGIIWGIGMPGAGKTILASAIIAHLIDHFKDTGVCVAFAYCRYTEPVSVTEILAALVRQLLEQCPYLLQFIEPLYQRHSLQGTKLTQKELLGLLRQFSRIIRVIFIIDGLDEASYDTQFDLVEAIASLNARFLITSRPLDRLKSSIPDAVFFEVVAHAEDIELLVAQKIHRDPRFAGFLEKHKLRDEVVARVTQNSGGMFLHAALQVEILRHSLTVKDLHKHMGKLPPKIEDMYAVTLTRVNAQEPSHADLAKRILIWVIYAARTLSVRELQYAVATCPETYQFEDDRLVEEETLLSVCCGLVTVEKESQGVRLVHYTAMDSLPSLLSADFPHPHALLAEVCMARLVGCGIHNFMPTMLDDLRIALIQHPLLRYARNHWAHHVKTCHHLPSTTTSALQFLSRCEAYPEDNSDMNLFRSAVQIRKGDRNIEHLNPVQVASRYGLHFLFQQLLEQCPGFKESGSLNSRTEIGITPLMLASMYGHLEMVQSLVALEAVDVNATDHTHNKANALIYANGLNRGDIIKAIAASKKLDINQDECATLRQLTHRHDESEALPLLDLPDIEIPEDVIAYALSEPKKLMCQRILKIFFQEGGKAQHYLGEQIGKVFTTSIRLGHSESTDTHCMINDKILIYCRFPNRREDSAPRSPSDLGEDNILHLLDFLKPDFPLTQTDRFGRTALMMFAWAGMASAVPRVLKQPGIDVNAVEIDGYTALAFAAKQCRDPVVRILVQVTGRDINTRNYLGWTPLMVASQKGYVEIVRTLLAQEDIRVDTVGEQQWTAVMLAANGGHAKVLKAFSEYSGSVDANCRGEDGETALMLAASEGHEEAVACLLGFNDIEVNAAAKDGTTALMLAAYMGHEAVVRLLLAVPGIEVDAIGRHGVTALSVARGVGHDKIIRLLSHE